MNKKDKIPVIAVVGPTASGKSRLAVELALAGNGEVISADSMQIYKGMNIGTAKPTVEEMRGVPHHLLDFAPLTQPFSVADYVSLASDCISQVSARGKLPVIAGGTGLYIRSLLQNIQFTENDKDETLRKQLAQKAEEQGVQSLMEELKSFDPESAERIHPNNLSRVIRAIEIYRTTGFTMTEQLERSKQAPTPYDACMIGLDFRDRQKLYDRINRRVDLMIRDGLLHEAEEILNRPGSQTAMQAIGYKELLPYFRSECSLEEAVESIKRESRRYAKRQLTWFRRDENIHWIMVDEYRDFEEISNQAFRLVDRKGW
ncbi:tRNA (adenosine(37)-N6)-dimethylallyltransferase MiaA [Caproiciproducens faecalis]|uniref:tRNA dimethylallyltransferase n=1 Tax=Caproiciproducens faecalis TaxID=2820301 RepID=A0ABS7DQR3_9FIRM|nr:tRNA (adenosine(37)-N6)-dimethylallyltransferase MiaA [Caproiciproducens faecalis]MBW7573649.1 tRNA (adenosine(37)-N6)-dimethylallyltransferase MiaA [Caproiciproducens faecalis]